MNDPSSPDISPASPDEGTAYRKICMASLGIDFEFIENCAQSLRNSGIAVDYHFPEDLDALYQLVQKDKIDLIAVSEKTANFPIDGLISVSKASQHETALLIDGDPLLFEKYGANIHALINTNEKKSFEIQLLHEYQNLLTRRKLNALSEQVKIYQNRCEKLMHESREAISYIHDGLHVRVNTAYKEFFGITDEDEMAATTILDLVKSDYWPVLKPILNKMQWSENIDASEKTIEVECLNADQNYVHAILSLQPVIIEDEHCIQLSVQMPGHQDSSKLQQATEQQSPDAVLNIKENFLHKTDEALNEIKTNTSALPLSLHYISVNNLREIREDLGLMKSELLIKQFGNAIKTLVSSEHEQAVSSRFNDHAFTLLTRTDKEKAIKLSELIERDISESIGYRDKNSKKCHLEIAIGIANTQISNPADSNQLIDQAYDASVNVPTDSLYKVFEVEEETQRRPLQKSESAEPVNLVKYALEKHKLTMKYQALVPLNLESSQHSYIVHPQFVDVDHTAIPYSEQLRNVIKDSQQAIAVDGYIVERAVKRLKDTADDNLAFHLPISMTLLNNQEFWFTFSKQLRLAGLSSQQFSFIINAEDVHTDLSQVETFMINAKKLGLSIYLGNYGQSSGDLELVTTFKGLSGVYLSPKLTEDMSGSAHLLQTLKIHTEALNYHQLATIITTINSPTDLTIAWESKVSYVSGDFIHMPSMQIDFDFTQYQ